MSDHLGERTARCLYPLLVCLYVVSFYLVYLFTDTTSLLPSYQDEAQWLLYHHFIDGSFGRGYFPLWTPDLYCGMPFLAWSHSASLYPFNPLFTLFGFGRAVWINQAIHALIYALGLFYLARRLGASRSAALFAVIVSGAFTVQGEWGNFLPNIRTGVWGPWWLLTFYRLAGERRLRWLLLNASITLVMYLGGQVELLGLGYELVGAAALAAAGFHLAQGRPGRELAAPAALLAAAFVLGYLVSSAQTLPTLELTSLSIRGAGLAYGYFRIFSSPWNVVIWMPYLLTGVAAVPIFCALARSTSSPVHFILAVALLFCLALIHNLFGIMWLMHHLPVARGLLAHSRIAFFAGIILAALLALGFDRMTEPSGARWLKIMGGYGIAAAAIGIYVIARHRNLLLAGAEPAMGEAMSRALGAFLVVAPLQFIVAPWLWRPRRLLRRPRGLRLLFLVAALLLYAAPVLFAMPRNALDPFRFPRQFVDFFSSQPGRFRVQTVYPWDRWERVRIPLQAGILYGTRAADGFITVSVDRYTRLMNAFIPGTFREQGGRISDLEATKALKEGGFLTDRNLSFLNLIGLKYLVTEDRNLKFPSHYFLAYPDSPLVAAGSGGQAAESGDRPAVNLSGRAAARIFTQPGDRLEFGVQSDQPGSWWVTTFTPEGGKTHLLFARRTGPAGKYQTPGAALAADRPQTGELAFCRPGGDRSAGRILDPTIINPEKYFQRLPLAAPFNIFVNPGALPPAFLVPRVVSAGREQALALLTRPGFDPARAAVVEGLATALPDVSLAPSEGARIVRYAPERLEIAAWAAVPRLLLLTDVYFPGWRLWVNGKEERIYPADYAFRGLVLEPGRNEARMSYEPKSFALGLWISLSTLAGLGAAGLAARMKNR